MGSSVLVTVGTTKFDALIESIDSLEFAALLRKKGYDRLVIQKGNGSYAPRYFEFTPSLAELMKSSALVISHAGAGSIFETLSLGKPLIVVPNDKLMDNHQIELANHLAQMQHAVANAVETLDATKLRPYQRGSAAGIVGRIDMLVG